MATTKAAVARSRKRLLQAWFKRSGRALPKGFAAWTPNFGRSAITALEIANGVLAPKEPPRSWTVTLADGLLHDGIPVGVIALGVLAPFRGPIETEGNNRGPKVRIIQAVTQIKPGAWPYCAAGVFFALLGAGWKHAKAFLDGELEAFVPAWVAAARARKYGMSTVPVTEAREGDAVAFNWAGVADVAGAYDHIGLVRGPARNGLLPTREANTGPGAGGNQSDGDGVWDRERPINAGMTIIRFS